MKKILVATSNPGKLAEINFFLSDLSIETVSLTDIGMKADAPETGNTFEENAVMKAKYYCQKSGLPTIADDGGFEIDALNGEPGVHTHRWINKDRENSDEELIKYTFNRMKHVPNGKRGAQLKVVIAFCDPFGFTKTTTAFIRGIIPEKPSGIRTKGFPFRSILYLPEIGKYYNHDFLTKDETEKYNHRKFALDQLKPLIRQALTI